jgi:hypothetical protein
METVQLQCGNCKQVMGISVEHLGGQVQCPHCRSVVQTPPRTAPAAENRELQQRESIFGGAEPSDDLFGAGLKVRQVEMPPQPAPAQPEIMAPPPPMFSGQPAAGEEEPAEELRQFQRRPIYDRGVVQMSILIFLVPYSILTSAIIAYLIFYATKSSSDPLQYLPDPAPAKGGPQRVTMQPRHDVDLSKNLRTKLKKPITIGDLTVTPEKVRLTADGDLELFLRARNEAAKVKFEPISDSWLRYDPNKAGNEPYTFLQSESKTLSPIYGAFLRYQKSFDGKEEHAETYAIGPHEQSFMVLQTTRAYRDVHVAKIVKSDDNYLWRVRVRRGFVKKNGKDVSATAVIGVEFSASEIERDKQL